MTRSRGGRPRGSRRGRPMRSAHVFLWGNEALNHVTLTPQEPA